MVGKQIVVAQIYHWLEVSSAVNISRARYASDIFTNDWPTLSFNSFALLVRQVKIVVTFCDSEFLYLKEFPFENGFWPGLGLPRPKAIVVIPKNQPLPKH